MSLKITVPGWEDWDVKNERFSTSSDVVLVLEHSLLSLSKWESKYHKHFIGNENLTKDEIQYYIKCMTLSKNISDAVYDHLTAANLKEIQEYIVDPMTATTFSSQSHNKKPVSKNKIITSEVIYCRMTFYNIPFECQKWHLNRLLTLLRVCSIESQPKQKMNNKDKAAKYRSLNAARRAKNGTRG